MRPRLSESRDSAPHELPLRYSFICKAPTKLIVGSECPLSPSVSRALHEPSNQRLPWVTLQSDQPSCVLVSPRLSSHPWLKVLSHSTDGAPRVAATTQDPWNARCCILSVLDPIMGGFQQSENARLLLQT